MSSFTCTYILWITLIVCRFVATWCVSVHMYHVNFLVLHVSCALADSFQCHQVKLCKSNWHTASSYKYVQLFLFMPNLSLQWVTSLNCLSDRHMLIHTGGRCDILMTLNVGTQENIFLFNYYLLRIAIIKQIKSQVNISPMSRCN